MEGYRLYLEAKDFSESTVSQYVNLAHRLERFTGKAGAKVAYKDLLGYIHSLQVSPSTINGHLSSFQHYFNYLMHAGVRQTNPATYLRVKGRASQTRGSLLDFEELESAYQRYEGTLEAKGMLSLLIYQGLSLEDLRQLEISSIDLETAQLYIVAGTQSNERRLSLAPPQILLLHRLIGARQGYLFAFRNSRQVRTVVSGLLSELRLLLPGLANSLHLRRIVLSHWLKSEDVRIVQYKAGHRYVSSTERYQQDYLDALKEDIASLHPLNR